MKKIFYPIALLLLVLLAASCSEDEIKTFDPNNYVYFDMNLVKDQNYAELSYTFLFEQELETKEFKIPVKILGRYPDKERTFKITYVDSLTTAKEGVHFTIDNNSQKIEAGKSEGFAILTLHRTAEMDEKEFEVMLKITDDGEMLPGHKTYLKVKVSNLFMMPDWWPVHGPYYGWLLNTPHPSSLSYYFGIYTEQKCLLLLEYKNMTDASDPWADNMMHFTNWDGTKYSEVSEGVVRSDIAAFKKWLKNEKGDPYDPILRMKVSESVGLNAYTLL